MPSEHSDPEHLSPSLDSMYSRWLRCVSVSPSLSGTGVVVFWYPGSSSPSSALTGLADGQARQPQILSRGKN